ncbi:SpoIIE family protein phosphatase [Streptomyces sp. NBC_00057]|uniref:SpoIIE family protein phosphatase n=1 Tax=Streptomyces sp. NBC_00057 TaxID=2975634 RepID=UPI00386E9A68
MTVRRWGRPRGGLPVESAERRLAEGSVLALCTDGILQAPDRDVDAGPDQLPRTMVGPARPLEQLCDAVATTLLTGPRSGDAPLLLARPAFCGQDGPSAGSCWSTPRRSPAPVPSPPVSLPTGGLESPVHHRTDGQ